MKYDPKSANSLIADGEYDAEIAIVDEQISKKGNEMLKLTVRVWAGGGGPRTVFDYVVNPSTLWRLKQIAAATGQQELFASGEMGPDDIRGANVRVTIKTHKDQEYGDKNVIARYLAAETGVGAPPSNARTDKAPTGIDDDIPF